MSMRISLSTRDMQLIFVRSEAVPGALPKNQNLPQRHKLGLYPERISGTSFTAKRNENRQTFLYRIYPSTAQSTWKRIPEHPLSLKLSTNVQHLPDQFVWPPFEVQQEKNFIDSMNLIGGAGDPTTKNGVAYYSYAAGKSMEEKSAFYSADGDWLIGKLCTDVCRNLADLSQVAQLGVLDIQTEMGWLRVRPREIAVVPRGVRFRVALPAGPARGHIVEAFSGHINVPEIGVSGTLCLANIRDFEIPKATYVDIEDATAVYAKFGGMLHKASMKGSAFNAVGWQGNYYPFKYDLGKFMPLGATLYDHQDPSIFTVLTAPSGIPDHPALDFLYMGPRWFVMEDTFQLPYFHRNVMSEFSGVISGGFDVSKIPKPMWGMCGLNNSVSPHGLSKEEVELAMTKKLEPERIPDNHHGFLFESW